MDRSGSDHEFHIDLANALAISAVEGANRDLESVRVESRLKGLSRHNPRSARCQKSAKKLNDRSRRPSNDDPRLDQNISLEEQRTRLEDELESETDAGTISSLRGQIDVLDARKAENELLASKVPNSEVIYVDGDGNCFWSNLSLFKDAADLPSESPESIMRGTAEVLRAVNIQDGQCKSSCYFAWCWVVRIDLTFLT